MLNALNNLYVHESEINDMNVFPVADGDTGTNMRLTLENGLNHAKSEKHFGKYIKELSTGMLLGARGNSGVILSQLFRGMYLELRNDSIVNPREFCRSCIKGYQTAYKSVLKPVEGTILTVSRMGIENIYNSVRGSISMADTLKLYLTELNKALLLTPSMLPALKEANVLDSGAKGYITIVEGMYKYLVGDIIDRDLNEVSIDEIEEEINYDIGYHMELEIKPKEKDFPLDIYTEKLKNLSLDYKLNYEGEILKVIVNTTNPTPIITESRKLGEMVSFKLDNNKIEEKKVEKEIPFKAIVYIACVSGSGVSNLYQDLGVDILLGMNPSAQDFIDGFKRCNSEKIVILPNDKNIIETAHQAIKLASRSNVEILPTLNVIEGYYSLAMDVPDSSVENRLNAIKENVDVICLSTSKAIKDYHKENVDVKVGDYVTYISNIVVSSTSNTISSILEGLKSINNIDSKSNAFILLGKNFNKDLEDELTSLINNSYPNLEVTILDGGQEKEDLIVGIL